MDEAKDSFGYTLNFERDEESGIPLHAGCPSRDLSEGGEQRKRETEKIYIRQRKREWTLE